MFFSSSRSTPRVVHLGRHHAQSKRRLGDPAGRNLPTSIGDRIAARRFLIRDRDAKHIESFDELFRSEGLRVVRTPIRSPRANAFAERFVGTVRRECLNYVLVVSRRHLEKVLKTWSITTATGRIVLNCGHRIQWSRLDAATADRVQVQRKDLLGGLLHEYVTAA